MLKDEELGQSRASSTREASHFQVVQEIWYN